MFLGSSQPVGAKEIWRTAAPPWVRFFFWLVLHGRCWTAERICRHGLQPDDTCIMCDQGVESIDHILLFCCYSREVWHSCLAKLQLLGAAPFDDGHAIAWWLRVRKMIPKPLRKGFDSFFFLMGWTLWKERNARTFSGVATPASQLVLLIQEVADDWCKAGFRHLAGLLAGL